MIDILSAVSASDGVIIGGQAINAWSTLYGRNHREPWESLRPFSSVDGDALASKTSLFPLVKKLESLGFKAELLLPANEEEAKINTAVVYASNSDIRVSINLLRSPLGLNPLEILQTAQPLSFNGKKITLLHPLLCFESKIFNLLELAQNSRQDKKHLLLATANLRSFLASCDADKALQISKRIIALSTNQIGLNLLTRHKINPLEAIPWAEWKISSSRKLAAFAKTKSPVEKKVNEKLAEEIELKNWLHALNPKPAKNNRSQLFKNTLPLRPPINAPSVGSADHRQGVRKKR